MVDAGKGPRAALVIEKTWGVEPHPDLTAVYRAARPAADGVALTRAVGRLAATNPGHRESHVALAEAALEARLWGEARSHLRAAAGADAPARVCRLMARLEEDEHGDAAAAREWLVRASVADPDPAWVCESCSNVAAEWTVLCGKCEGFNRFAWRTPPRVARLAGPGDAEPAVLTQDEGGAG